MSSVPPLLSFLLTIAAGWIHRHQLIVIEFLQAENRLLKGRLGGRRIRGRMPLDSSSTLGGVVWVGEFLLGLSL